MSHVASITCPVLSDTKPGLEWFKVDGYPGRDIRLNGAELQVAR